MKKLKFYSKKLDYKLKIIFFFKIKMFKNYFLANKTFKTMTQTFASKLFFFQL